MGILGNIFKEEEKAVKKSAKKTTATTKSKVVDEDEKVVVSERVLKNPKNQGDSSAYKFLLQPLITEKATELAMSNKYCFIVPVTANKSEVMKRVSSVYGVKPVKANFIKVIGKRVRFGRKFGKRKDFKKAIITLKKEDKIELYEGV